jgi:hypothetical protein
VFVIVPSYPGTIIAKLLKGRLIGNTKRRGILEKKRDLVKLIKSIKALAHFVQ